MCGIAGIVSLTNTPIHDARRRIQRMTSMLFHRGPDYQGTYVSPDGFAALGNTRLAIVDPNCREAQPMVSGDGSAYITFNGEIYNYPAVRELLSQRNVPLRTHIDTESVLEGIRHFGRDFIHSLDGMWAFAYYDLKQRMLMLSRDLMGERHVYYRITKDEFIFASEPTPIVADSEEQLSLDPDIALSAIRFGAPPPGQSLITGIRRMLPGHDLIVEGGAIREVRRTRLQPEKWFDFFRRAPSEAQVIELYEQILFKVCQARIPTEVPFICTLSGGIDSTLVSLFASDFGKRPIRTLFGQATDEAARNLPGELDEYSASQFTSARIRSDHQLIRLDANECVPSLERMAADCFDGVMDPAPASFERLAQHVRKDNAKVLIISDGPDELLGGYRNDLRLHRIDTLRERNRALYEALRLGSATRFGRRVMGRLGLGSHLISPYEAIDPLVFRPMNESYIPDLLGRFFPLERILRVTSGHYGTLDAAYAEVAGHLDLSQRRALSYASRSLPDQFNLRTDKAFLRASVEGRLPLQAPELVELMVATPSQYRFGEGTTTKHLLRRIVDKHLGPQIASRSKHGFSIALWNRPKIYAQLGIAETLANSSVFEDFGVLPGIREQILANTDGYRLMQWPLYVLARTSESLKRYNAERARPIQAEEACAE